MSTKNLARKTWKEKLNCGKSPEVKILSKPFGAMKAGDSMLIPSPSLIQEYIDAIPFGQAKTMSEMKMALAAQFNAKGTCHLTTGMFCRIVAESALEDLASGQKDMTPFWRLISSTDTIAKKLSCGLDFLNEQRQKEGIQ